jgi:hypothetical protein
MMQYLRRTEGFTVAEITKFKELFSRYEVSILLTLL